MGFPWDLISGFRRHGDPLGSPCRLDDGMIWVTPDVTTINHQHLKGLVSVPFWEYWTSPYSSHLVDHIPILVG